MKIKPRILIITSVILVITALTLSACCPLFGAPDIKPDEDEEMEVVSEDVEDSSSTESGEDEDQPSDVSESDAVEDEEEASVDQPAPFSFAESFDFSPLAAYDEFTTGLGLDDEEKQKIEVHLDIVGNNVWAGGPEIEPGGYQGYTDIVYYALTTISDNRESDGPPFNTQFTCGSYNWDVPTWVVCPEEFNADGIDEWHMLTMGLLENTPFLHDSHHGTFSAALDPDNDPANNFIALLEWPWDHYKNTDLWHIGYYDPLTYQWTAETYRSDWTQAYYNFFIVYYKNTVNFFLPVLEYPQMYFGGRLALEWTALDRNLENYGADVTQGDPDQQLFTWNNSVSIKDSAGYTHHLPDEYAFCSASGCKLKHDEYGKDLDLEAVLNLDHWCECTGCTSIPDCSCKMFKSEIEMRFAPPEFNPRFYDFFADHNQRTSIDILHSYRCFCVEGGN
jgi:hypothetical protein